MNLLYNYLVITKVIPASEGNLIQQVDDELSQ